LITLAQAQAEADAQANGANTVDNGKITANANVNASNTAKITNNVVPMVIGTSTTDDGDAA
jgi:hypothetical protein